MWTTLRADGVKGPFYIQTKSPKVAAMNPFNLIQDNAHIDLVPVKLHPRTKKRIRPGEAGMKAYLEFMIDEAQFLNPGDILISDGEKAFNTPLIQELMRDRNIVLFVIEPSILHQFMNPCDNNLHSVLKLSYYREISNRDLQHLPIDQKFIIAKKCWDKISQESVYRMFRKCGLHNTGEDKRSVIMKLMHEGLSCLGKFNGFHRQNLMCFLEWCQTNRLFHLASSLSPEMLRSAGFV